MKWKLKGEDFKKAVIEDYGFIYRITHIPTGKYYIGKKVFYNTITNRKRRRHKKIVESNWRKYNSSCKEMLEIIANSKPGEIKKEILKIVRDKINLTYWEVSFQMEFGCLLDENCLNRNVGGRYYRGKIKA